MGKKYQETGRVVSNEQVAPGIFCLTAEAPQIAEGARPGQFVHVLRQGEFLFQSGGRGRTVLCRLDVEHTQLLHLGQECFILLMIYKEGQLFHPGNHASASFLFS